MIQVAIIGTGALAKNLYHAFVKSNLVQLLIIGRSKDQLKLFPKAITTTDFNLAQSSDLILLAVSDTAITECEKNIGNTSAVIAHCAGSQPLDLLVSSNAAVMWPIQTFNSTSFVDFKTIPIMIEAKNIEALSMVREVSNAISTKVNELHSSKRKEAHLAAVFANNFSNYLFGVSKDLLEEFDLPSHLLDELILQTAKNATIIHPRLSQSGPAKRNDQKAIMNHLEMIYDKHHKELYEQLSKAIKDNNYEL